MPSFWLLSFPSYFTHTSVNKGRNNDSQGLFQLSFSPLFTYIFEWKSYFCFISLSFEQVTMDRIQIRNGGCSSCSSIGVCRFGVACTKKSSIPPHQHCLHQFHLASGEKKMNNPNLINIDAHHAQAFRLTGLAFNPLGNSNTSITILVNIFPLGNSPNFLAKRMYANLITLFFSHFLGECPFGKCDDRR